MNKNIIKISSILVLLLFASSYALPFFVQENCDMPESNNSAFHCTMAEMGCCEMMTECVVVPFHPVVSAPLNKVELQNDPTVDYFIKYTDNLELFEVFSYFNVNAELCRSEFHPGFQIPLLI